MAKIHSYFKRKKTTPMFLVESAGAGGGGELTELQVIGGEETLLTRKCTSKILQRLQGMHLQSVGS